MSRIANPDNPLWRLKKRRRIRAVILACLCLIPLLIILEKKVVLVGAVPFPVSGNVLAFIFININVILLLLMVFLVLRNLVELFFERRGKLVGARLRTKLVISFVSLSLIPTTLLFFIALQFVSTSLDYWFNVKVDRSLAESLTLAQDIYKEFQDRVQLQGERVGDILEKTGSKRLEGKEQDILEELLVEHELAGLTLISEERILVADVMDILASDQEVSEIPPEFVRRALDGETGLLASQAVLAGELVRSLLPLRLQGKPYVLVTTGFLPRERLERMQLISSGIEGYRQLQLLKNPLKTSILLMLLIVTLLIIFAAVWFGLYVSKGLTAPMNKLIQGIDKVVEGELDFVIEKDSGDEMGSLVDSFNRMTRDLLTSKLQVDEANQALLEINQETEKRRRYTEIILQNVTTGVISLDEEGRVLTINRFAEDLLKINRQEIINKNYRTILRLTHLTILEDFFTDLAKSGKTSIQRPLRITVNNETLSLRVNFTRLEDEQGRHIGVVIVFDNLTEIEKIQRMAAWREVARRIAHEVKNPLTPIQLSAQRLRKKYMERLGEEQEVFDSCTRTIINQVDELKKLVSEFSSFARMPAVKKSINSVTRVISEVLVLYEQAHKNVEFRFIEQPVPDFAFDQEQLKRVLVNLLDNGVEVMEARGLIEVEARADLPEKQVIIEVRDSGPGVSDADKPRLFEPYFSRRKSGTGLGLAIASTVVADHGGYIRVKDNEPAGARFIIELPLQSEV